MDDKHRSGPWEFTPSAFPNEDHAGYIRQNGHTIAAVLHDRGTQFNGMEIVPERDAANARLIAAAPALLEALRDAMPVLAHEMGEQHPTARAARAVINLATTGEEP